MSNQNGFGDVYDGAKGPIGIAVYDKFALNREAEGVLLRANICGIPNQLFDQALGMCVVNG
ncbi:hypothetical protein GQ56_0136035 [Burkholderia paludis]|nr:hypothetical protein GQ56_0136035 [Burkholderia paludis]